jgi:hypothetical protein
VRAKSLPLPFVVTFGATPPLLVGSLQFFLDNDKVGDTVEDIRKVNGPGIDSQEERDILNYKPKMEYSKPTINAGYYTVADSINLEHLEPGIRPLVIPKTVTTWNGSVDILDSLNDIQVEFDDRLKDSFATVPQRFLPMAIGAAQKLGYDISNGKIPFDLYKKALTSENSHERIILIDLFEKHQADVDGDLVAELYPDIIEMQQDWLAIIEFIKKGLFSQFVNQNELPGEISKDSLALQAIHDKEQELIARFMKAYEENKLHAGNMRKLHVLAPDSPEYYDAHGKFSNTYGTYRDLKRRVFTKNEIASLVQSKVENVQPFISSLVAFSDADVYKGATFNTLYGLLSQYSSGQQAQNGLRKVQALLKLSIDGKIETVDSTKENLRGLANNQHKTNVNKSLVKGVHLRNEIYGEIHDTIDGIQATIDPVFNMVAEHILDSMTHADKLYGEQSSDFYKIHTLDTDLRREKLGMLVDKDTARRFYKIIERLISFTGLSSWPTEAKLADWLKDFIDQEGLS